MQQGQTVCRILCKASDGMANQLIRLHFIGQGSCSCFSSGHERACHGQMRSTRDVSPQRLAILLWTRGWCCPVAVNPWAATYQELANITRNDLSNPRHTSRPCRVSGCYSIMRWALKLETTAPKPT
ncbi:hypothetical protein GGI43DRAFT_252024 [Trichoderma evansii]